MKWRARVILRKGCALVFAACALRDEPAAQVTWTLMTPSTAVRPAVTGNLVFDTRLGRSVLHSGDTTDVWDWDGTQWRRQQPAISPPARWKSSGALAYDTRRNRMVLFGGDTTASGLLNDTWEWDGTAWQQMTPAVSPSPRRFMGLVFDERRARTVGYGGYDTTSTELMETWEWDGTTWSNRGNGPSWGSRTNPNLNWAGMEFDGHRGKTILLLGIAPSGSTQTWEWDGNVWQQRQPAHAPSNRGSSPMAFDSSRSRMVLKGGAYTPDDTWEWDGTDWIQRTPLVMPPRFFGQAMTYDSVRRRVVAYANGFRAGSFTNYDVWEYGPVYPATHATFGAGCPGVAGIPTLDTAPGSLPWLGETFTLRLTNASPTTSSASLLLGRSSASWGAFRLPLDLTVAGMPGCWLRVSGDPAGADVVGSPTPHVLLPVALQNGTGLVGLPLPNTPSVLGTAFFYQALVPDVGANPAGIVLSNAGEARFGGR